jgi:hypothetical protein
MTVTDRAGLAFELADDAEALVRRAEDVLATASGPTARDVAETRLRECLALHTVRSLTPKSAATLAAGCFSSSVRRTIKSRLCGVVRAFL